MSDAPNQSQQILSHHRIYTINDTAVTVTLHEPSSQEPWVPEALIHHIWATQHIDPPSLMTTEEEPVIVFDPGQLNSDSGADFTNAHLRIGDIDWYGDVEIHRTSGAWFRHEHHLDARYNSVILHVTLYADARTGGLLRADDTLIPEVVLYPHLTAPLRQLLHDYHTHPDEPFLCAKQWADIPSSVRRPWIEALAEERLHAKKQRLAQRYVEHPDLEALLHERIFAGLGYAKNDEPMEALARRLPLRLTRAFTNPQDLEALHFGTSGLLPSPGDLLDSDRTSADYVMELRDRFRRLNTRLDLPVMDRARWKFFRLRPANFPPLRIAQGVALLQPGGVLHTDPLGTLVEVVSHDNPVPALRDTLRTRPSPFWNNHVRLEKPTAKQDPCIGRSRVDTLIINAVLPVMLLYAEQHERPGLQEHVFDILRRLPASRDSVIRRFAQLGTTPGSAFETQGLHHLYRTYCQAGRCLSCAIGHHLLGE